MAPIVDTAAALKTLRRKLQERGFYEKPTASHLAVWGAHAIIGCSAIAMLLASTSWWMRGVTFAVATFTFLCMSTIGHTASHSGLSKRGWVNHFVLYVTYPFFLGLSARYWVKSHVVIHHPAPNRIGVDRDCDLRPFFALNEEHVGDSAFVGAYRRIQGYVLPVLLPFNGFGIQIQGWRSLLQELAEVRRGKRPSPKALLDLGCLFAHYAVFVVLPVIVFGPATALAIYALRISLLGILLFAVLAPGHYPEEAACIGAGWDREDFALRQLATTVNFRTGFVGRMICNGLEFQIEHHLFPTISHAHLPEVSVLVREFCEREGLPYRTMSWPRAIWESYRVFFVPKAVLADAAAFRPAAPSVPEPSAPEEAIANVTSLLPPSMRPSSRPPAPHDRVA